MEAHVYVVVFHKISDSMSTKHLTIMDKVYMVDDPTRWNDD